jgi:hypothetical protein
MMKPAIAFAMLVLLVLSGLWLKGEDARPAPIQTVEIRDRALHVNGKPFFPIMARHSGDSLYLFAVNYDERARETAATIQIEGLSASATIDVVDESRTMQAREGAFGETFAPLAVHIYRLAAPPTTR